MVTMTTLAIAAGTAVFATTFFAGGNYAYSNPGVLFPATPNLNINVQPSPLNIWRYHEQITANGNGVTQRSVIVDIDGDGVSDTLLANSRVLVTDFLVSQPNARLGWTNMGPFRLLAQCPGVAAPVPLWEFGPTVHPTNSGIVEFPFYEHMTTPIVVPQGAALIVEISNLNQGSNVQLEVYLNGRVSSF